MSYGSKICAFFYYSPPVIEVRCIRFPLIARCSRCRRWKSWRARHNCTPSCDYSGMCDPCIADFDEEDYMRRIRSGVPGEADFVCSWPHEDTDNPAELKILRLRANEDEEEESL